MALYPNSVPRTIEGKIGDYPSFLDFGTTDGIADTSAAFNKAIDSLDASGRGTLYIPGGTYIIDLGVNPIRIDKPVRIYGDPGKTIIQTKSGTSVSGKGLIDITSGGVILENLVIDGNITTPTGLTYTSDFTQPTDAALINGTSIWIHGDGSGERSNFQIINCTIQHTGGFAILGDARDGELRNIIIEGCTFKNNRPHLFGTSGGDQNYGSWTGGVLMLGNGTSSMCHDVLIDGNTWKCNTGNACWQWAPAISYLHSNIRIVGNHFEDQGLDAVEVGALAGGTVANNTFRRIGYISTTDDTIGTPKWLPNLNATAIDSTGLAINVSITGNSGVSINGGAFNLDGLGNSTVSGNSFRLPYSTDPEYSIDSITGIGPSSDGLNWMQGVVTGNTNDTSIGGNGVSITNNTFVNCGGGAILLYAARNCTAIGNTIVHPDSGAQVVPISIGNTGSTTNKKSVNNLVTGNNVSWNPGSPAPIVFEDPTYGAFTSDQVNYIFHNNIVPASMPEFQRDPNSGSSTALVFSTNVAGAAIQSGHNIQREGKASDYTSALKMYLSENGTAYQHVQLQGYWKSASRGPLMNVSEGGTGGVIATGPRTVTVFNDCIVTGKGDFDAFVSLTDTTYDDADADLLDNSYALLRFKPSVGYIEQSISTSGGSRVWAPIVAAGGTAAGADKNVQYNSSGAFAGSNNFNWDNTAQLLTVTAVDAVSAGIACATGFIQSDVGFYTPGTASTAIGAPNGGVTALSLVSIRDDGASGVTIARAAATARIWGFGVTPGGDLSLNDDTAVASRMTVDSSGLFSWGGGATQLDQSGNISISGVVTATGASAGFNVTSTTAYNSIQTSGGIYVQLGAAFDQAFYPKAHASTGTLNTPASGYGGLAYHTASTYYYYDGSAWQAIDFTAVATGITTPGGSNTDVQFNNASAFGGSGNFTWDNTGQQVKITALNSASIGLWVATGYMQSDVGYYSPGSASDTVKIPSGGVTALSLISVRNDAVSGVTISRTSSTARTWGFAVLSDGSFALNDDTAASVRMKIDTSGLFYWGAGNTILDQSGNITLVGVLHAAGASAGVNVTGTTAYNSVQTSGGFFATLGVTTDQALYPKGYSSSGSLNSPGGGYGGLAYKTGANYWYWNGSSWVAIDLSSLSGATSPGGSNTNVQYNSSGSFAGSGNFTWTNSSQLLNVTALNSSSAGISVTTGFIQSDAGFLTLGSSSTAINVPNGGVTALSLISVRNDGTSGVTIARTAGTARTWGFGVNSDGTFGLNDVTGSAQRMKVDSAGTVYYGGGNTTFDQSGNISFVGSAHAVGSGAGFNSTGSSAFNSIQTQGGMYAQGGFTSDQAMYLKSFSISGPNSPGGSYGGLAFKSGSQYWYWNGSAWVTFDFSTSGGTTPAGSSGQVQFNNSGSFGASGNFTWNNGSQLLSIFALNGSSAGIAVATGYVQADAGFIANNSNFNVIQAPNGGMYAHSFTALTYINAGTSFGTPGATSGDSLNNGCLYYDTSSGTMKVKVVGSFQNILTGSTVVNSLSAGTGISLNASSGAVTITNSGVTTLFAGSGISLTGNTGAITISVSGGGVTGIFAGTGVSVNANTGNVTVSIGQAVNTFSSVTFSTLSITSSAFACINATGSIQAGGGFVTGNGASNAIQATSGGMFSNLGYNTGAGGVYDQGGVVVINSSRQWTGNAVLANGNVNVASGFVFSVASSFFGQSPGGLAGSSNTFFFQGGILYAFSSTSDARLKTTTPYSYGLAAINNISPVFYEWNDEAKKAYPFFEQDRKQHIGFLAQEIQAVMPEAVTTNEKGYLEYDKDSVLASLVRAVQELSAKLERLDKTD